MAKREYSLGQVIELLETAFKSGAAGMDIDKHEILERAHGKYSGNVTQHWENCLFENARKRQAACRCCTAVGEIAGAIARLKGDDEVTKSDFETACTIVEENVPKPPDFIGVVCT